MRLSDAKPSTHEVDLFKAIQRNGPNIETSKGHILAKRAELPRERVMVKDHRILGPIWHDLMDGFEKLNSHGAAEGNEAFGPKSHEMQDPPTREHLAQQRKKKKVPANGHHGATPAVSYGVGKPRVTPPADAATHAPPHSSYFHEPPHQPTMPTKTAGGSDDLRKQEAADNAIKQAQRRPFASPDDI